MGTSDWRFCWLLSSIETLIAPQGASLTIGGYVMSIDRETVDHVAKLARLALSDEERDRIREQLSTILGHINVIAEADTSGVSASAHILPMTNVMTGDTSRPSMAPKVLLQNAPGHEDQYFRVRAAIEEGE
jgi:aspartyl-tRNA(Asn)/glutamyl-tRNA(Gln) amidotransferase subunit C